MASPFNVELTMGEGPDDAQARAVTALNDPARAVGLRLSNESPGELSYKPQTQWPFLVALWHTLQGEKMTVKFTPNPDGGTKVAITGSVPSGKQSLAADPGHWSGALSS
jgi:hypothetical protein